MLDANKSVTALCVQDSRDPDGDNLTNDLVEEHIAGTGGTVARLYSIKEIPKRYFRSLRKSGGVPQGKALTTAARAS